LIPSKIIKKILTKRLRMILSSFFVELFFFHNKNKARNNSVIEKKNKYVQYVKKLFGHPFIDLLGRKFQNEERIFS
jgi:hypothetical protein